MLLEDRKTTPAEKENTNNIYVSACAAVDRLPVTTGKRPSAAYSHILMPQIHGIAEVRMNEAGCASVAGGGGVQGRHFG